MVTQEIRDKVRQIEIATRRLIRSSLTGESTSVIKGIGLDFDQIRPYQEGDDVRFIDWKASSRQQSLLVRQYQQEQTKSIIIAADVSKSGNYASSHALKRDMINQIGSVLALVAQKSNDAVGLMLFSDKIEKIIPPARGRRHVLQVLELLFSCESTSHGTSLTHVAQKIASLRRKDSITCIVSDFLDEEYERAIAALSHRGEVLLFSCSDICEKQFPSVGFIQAVDPESGGEIMLDTRSRSASGLNRFLRKRSERLEKFCTTHAIDLLSLTTDTDFLEEVVAYFCKRLRQRHAR